LTFAAAEPTRLNGNNKDDGEDINDDDKAGDDVNEEEKEIKLLLLFLYDLAG
jgi:hypothetical protein